MIKKVLAILLAFLYSVVCVLLGPAIKTQSFHCGTKEVLMLLLCFVIFSAINLLGLYVISNWKFEIKNEKAKRWVEEPSEGKLLGTVWSLIFLSWIPAYLVLYPAVLSYDMLSQTMSALGTITNNHHPILHTYLIRVFMNFGDKVASSYEFGLGVLAFLQMIILSYALARLVCLLRKKKAPNLVVLLTFLGSALWYMNAVLSVTMIKDTLHAAFLVLFVCHFVEIVTEPAAYIARKSNYFLLPIISFLMFATRNNGYHIYIFCFGGLLLFRIIKIKKIRQYILLIVSILLPIVMFKIYTGPVFTALNVAPGEVREALCIPIQQLQRVAINKADELTPEQTYKMDYYIDNLAWRDYAPGRIYDPYFADPAKSCFYSHRYEEDPVAFWKFYLQIGKQYTTEYVKAFLCNTLGYWYPGYYEYSYVMYENYDSEMFVVPLERKSFIDENRFLAKVYESLCSSDFWRETPGIRVFFVSGVAPWILLYAVLLTWKKRDNLIKCLPLFLPLVAQYGIMILSPMSSFRYAWPFFLMLPLCYVAVWGKTDQ